MVYISLTTVPDRWSSAETYKEMLDSLLTQEYEDNYVVLLNIPTQYTNYGSVTIPDWLIAYHEKLQVVRGDQDYGPITNLLYPLQYVPMQPDDIIIVVDDDHVYHSKLIRAHIEKLAEYPQNHGICFRGNRLMEKIVSGSTTRFQDVNATFPLTTDLYVQLPDHWHSVSYRRHFLLDDIFTDAVLNLTWNNDLLMGYYAATHNFYFVCASSPYEIDFRQVSTAGRDSYAFPIIKNTPTNHASGCNLYRQYDTSDIWDNEMFRTAMDSFGDRLL